MHSYFTIISLVAGICLGFGILYLVVGLRRKADKPLTFTFVLFALFYAITLINGIRWYSATNLPEHIGIYRFDAIFVAGVFIALNWYISYYSGFRPRIFLWLLSAALILPALVFILSPATYTGEVSNLTYIILPWGEKLVRLILSGSVWNDWVQFARFVSLGYIIFALITQYKHDERQPAIIIGLGLLPFIIGIVYEIFGEIGFVPFIPLGELGFVFIAIAASLQMAVSVIQTEEELELHRNKLEEMIEERTDELEAAHAQILTQVQETTIAEERSRLARDLHDVITQILFSINLIAMRLPHMWQRDPAMAERSTNELQRLTRGALADMRIMLRELRPHTITATKLETLLTQLCEGIAARHDIPLDVNIDPICELPPKVHIALYRIAQETMSNIAKHAEANQVSLHLSCDEWAVHLTIRDDGHGFEIHNVPSEHMGLEIMRERAARIGADLTIQSQPGHGTTVALTWPISQNGEDADE
jgi:signal transduction histidine kinase